MPELKCCLNYSNTYLSMLQTQRLTEVHTVLEYLGRGVRGHAKVVKDVQHSEVAGQPLENRKIKQSQTKIEFLQVLLDTLV